VKAYFAQGELTLFRRTGSSSGGINSRLWGEIISTSGRNNSFSGEQIAFFVYQFHP